MAAEAAADRGTHGNRWLPREPAEWLKAAVSATTALGVATYAVLRVDYALFYDRFGLKPEDVGLGQAELISQSLSGVALMLIVFFCVFALFAVVLWFLDLLRRDTVREFRDVRHRYGTLAAVLSGSVLVGGILGRLVGETTAAPWLLLAVAPVALWFVWRISRAPELGASLMFGGLGVGVFAGSVAFALSPLWTAVGFVGWFVLAVAGKRWGSRAGSRSRLQSSGGTSAHPGPQVPATTPTTETPRVDEAVPQKSRHERRIPPARTRRVLLVLGVALTVAFTETLLALSAVSDAYDVRSGHAVQPTMLGIPLVSWGGRAVDVLWQGDPPVGGEALAHHCFLYLGQGDGSVLLFDHDAGRTVRVSSADVVLSIQPVADDHRVCPR